MTTASNLKEENEELKKQIDEKESKLKDFEEQLKDWKRMVEKMRGNLNIYIRIKPMIICDNNESKSDLQTEKNWSD